MSHSASSEPSLLAVLLVVLDGETISFTGAGSCISPSGTLALCRLDSAAFVLDLSVLRDPELVDLDFLDEEDYKPLGTEAQHINADTTQPAFTLEEIEATRRRYQAWLILYPNN